MKKERDFYAQYVPSKIPQGKLDMRNGVSFWFPIEEKLARCFTGHLNMLLEEAYQRGLNDGAEFPTGNSKNFQDDKRIQHVYVQDGILRVASICLGFDTPQYAPGNQDLLADQVNGMIDRAEERGCVKGYRACLRDQRFSKPTDDLDDDM